MKSLLRPNVLLIVGSGAVLIALGVVGIIEGTYSELLVGALVAAAVGATVWNRRLLWAQRREIRQQTVALRLLTKQVAELKSALDELGDAASRPQSTAVAAPLTRGGQDAQAAETAARFNWLARRASEQEKTLATFLARIENVVLSTGLEAQHADRVGA